MRRNVVIRKVSTTLTLEAKHIEALDRIADEVNRSRSFVAGVAIEEYVGQLAIQARFRQEKQDAVTAGDGV